jgi:hypothetical protein
MFANSRSARVMLNGFCELKEKHMRITFLHSIALVGLLGCCSGAHADARSAAVRPALLPVSSVVVVKEVIGQVEYAYDGTGWKSLQPGKQLRPGATLRASLGSTAVLRVPNNASLFKLSPSTTMHITAQTPMEEVTTKALVAAK